MALAADRMALAADRMSLAAVHMALAVIALELARGKLAVGWELAKEPSSLVIPRLVTHVLSQHLAP